jgi:hypothetical protein
VTESAVETEWKIPKKPSHGGKRRYRGSEAILIRKEGTIDSKPVQIISKCGYTYSNSDN